MSFLSFEKIMKDLTHDSTLIDESTADTIINILNNSGIIDQSGKVLKIEEVYAFFKGYTIKDIQPNELAYEIQLNNPAHENPPKFQGEIKKTKPTSSTKNIAYYRGSKVELIESKSVFTRIFPNLILNHASIPKIHGRYIKENKIFLITDTYESNLYIKFQNRPAKVKVIHEFLSIISLISYFHFKRFEKFLISPTNIFLNEHGNMILDDIENFKEFNKNEEFKTDEINKKYLSPEQLIENLPTHKSHVWTLGCVLYFLVTGKNPYFNVYTENLIEWVVFQGNVPSDVDNELYRKFRMVFRKVFVLKPKKRLSVSEFYVEVEEILKNISMNQI